MKYPQRLNIIQSIPKHQIDLLKVPRNLVISDCVNNLIPHQMSQVTSACNNSQVENLKIELTYSSTGDHAIVCKTTCTIMVDEEDMPDGFYTNCPFTLSEKDVSSLMEKTDHAHINEIRSKILDKLETSNRPIPPSQHWTQSEIGYLRRFQLGSIIEQTGE